MQEELEANQREMQNMEKSWEEKLKEAKELEEAEEREEEEKKKALLMGVAHLVNLNEDPFLDRKVTYQMKEGVLTIGRRMKDSTNMVQLGGTGI
jgi:hypothetical protein